MGWRTLDNSALKSGSNPSRSASLWRPDVREAFPGGTSGTPPEPELTCGTVRMSESLTSADSPRADARLVGVRRVAIVPAYNEAQSVGAVVAEIRATDRELEVVVIDDGSTDGTAAAARQAGADVVRLPFNLGIGGAMQTGYQYARDHGFDLAVQIDGDGQHNPSELPRLIHPILAGSTDMVVGTRFADGKRYRPPFARRIGIVLFAWLVSLIVQQRVTDTTSGFRAVNRKGIVLFASDYPHDYPEVETTVLVFRHKLRMVEVPVEMRTRASGRSSITLFRSIYYVIKVSLALLIGLFRRYSTPQEG
jgi:glycosyltransferase involved in cell wall biosynthesis